MTDQQSTKLCLARARCELHVLGRLSAGRLGPFFLRRTLDHLREWGITWESFGQDDTRAIFTAIEHGVSEPALRRAELCRVAMRSLGLWVEDDERDFCKGMMWGPGPLACLLLRLPFDEHALMLACSRLGDAIESTKGLA